MNQLSPKDEVITAKPIPTPKEVAEKKAAKERGDVVNTLNAIEVCLAGILEREIKLSNASTKHLKKLYKKQIKSSKKYLEGLYGTLKLEMYESASADLALERLV